MGEEVAQGQSSAGIDETDKATAPADDECCAEKSPLIEKSDGSVCQPQAEKSPKKAKPQDSSFEKSKKWYNISFMHRSSQHRRENTTDKNSSKLDNRHSWHLNDSVEMWVNTSPSVMFRGLLHVFVSDVPHRAVLHGLVNRGMPIFPSLALLARSPPMELLFSAAGARRTHWIIHDNKSARRKIDYPWKFHQMKRPAREKRVPMPTVSRNSDQKSSNNRIPHDAPRPGLMNFTISESVHRINFMFIVRVGSGREILINAVDQHCLMLAGGRSVLKFLNKPHFEHSQHGIPIILTKNLSASRRWCFLGYQKKL